MKRAFAVTILLAVALIGVCWPPRSATKDSPPDHSVWFVLVHNAPTPTATPTPTRTPTTTPTLAATPSPTPTPIPAHVFVAAWCCQFDVPGNDGDRYDEEYVCFENDGGQAAHMTGWKVRDRAGNTYTFPTFELLPGRWVRLRTGSGTNTTTDLYWGLRRFVWNNNGDTVYLYDERGILIDEYTY